MTMQRLVIYGELCDLNTYINKERANKFMAAKIKREETDRVIAECMIQKLKPIDKPVTVDIEWVTKNLRKDLDNVAFAKKFILDGLVKAGVIEGDGRKHVTGFSDTCNVSKDNPRVIVTIN